MNQIEISLNIKEYEHILYLLRRQIETPFYCGFDENIYNKFLKTYDEAIA